MSRSDNKITQKNAIPMPNTPLPPEERLGEVGDENPTCSIAEPNKSPGSSGHGFACSEYDRDRQSSSISRIFDFLAVSEQLKTTLRWKNTPQMEPKESTASHSWHVSFLLMLIAVELDLKIDLKKALQIIIVHDLAEAITDDFDASLFLRGILDSHKKYDDELKAINKITALLPEKSGRLIHDLWSEYEEKASPEARFCNAMDKIEGIHHMVYRGSESFHFPNIVGTYANEAVANFNEINIVLAEHKKRLKPLLMARGWQWQDEYEIIGGGEVVVPENIVKIFDFIGLSEKLKETKRWLNTPQIIEKESSADHSWHLALLSIIVAHEFNLKVDLLRSIMLALVHDLIEAVTGDVDASLIHLGVMTKKEKLQNEVSAIEKIATMLPEKSGRLVKQLWYEYESGETAEGNFIKALDKIEGISHMLFLSHASFDHPELIAPYPNTAVAKFPELKPLLQELQKRLKPEYKKHGWAWKKEYELSGGL